MKRGNSEILKVSDVCHNVLRIVSCNLLRHMFQLTSTGAVAGPENTKGKSYMCSALSRDILSPVSVGRLPLPLFLCPATTGLIVVTVWLNV